MNELLKSLACSGTECFCWILVLFNILAVFYLVFCSFWKVSKLVKIFGWVHSGAIDDNKPHCTYRVNVLREMRR